MGKAPPALLTPEEGAAGNEDPLLTPEEALPPQPTAPKRAEAQEVERPSVKRKASEEASLSRACSIGSMCSDMGKVTSSLRYNKIARVGEGAYGSVFKAEHKETKEVVAVKATTRSEDPVLGGFPLSLLREINILRRLQHDNIVRIHEIALNSKGEPLIVMEFCQASLLELLNSRQHDLSLSELKYVVRQILDATRYMHERGILHRDLATKNILFNTSGEIKVCDFGISRVAFAQDDEYGFLPAMDLEDPNMIVSLPYRAIELLLGKADYGPALDVWAAGAILGEIIMCQGGRRQTFFGGSKENPNKTPQTTVEEIFSILGKPSEGSWPGHSKLPLWKSMCTSSIDKIRLHRVNSGEEKVKLKHFFQDGGGAGIGAKYNLSKTACFDLLGGLLTLNPAKRITAADSLQHGFFTEKPAPEWHAWHWAAASKEIPRGADMRKQRCGEGDAEVLLRQLSKEEVTRDKTSAKTVKERAREAMLERAKSNKLKVEETKKPQPAAVDRRNSSGKLPSNEEAALPKDWSKHWSSSKQRYYYHNRRTQEYRWDVPKA
mmetsp:Transcript_13857/g.31136  ORF Transcript_13857/g.31136 Transcript_13857/m.31136 type:complete len:549 (+) Transcript_13857:73-1719(+)